MAGGRIKTSEKLGDYIEWPEGFDLTKLPTHQSPDIPVELVSSTKLGSQLGISGNKLNFLFSELGWVNKNLKGWVATDQGFKQGAVQQEDSRSGVPYVTWPETIAKSSLLLSSVNDITGSSHSIASSDKAKSSINILATHRAIDGHLVNSKAEVLIDNWLYVAGIVHAYKRKLPLEENVYCDFYIPTGKVYIEFWSADKDPEYLARKEKKIAVYKKYDFKLIQLDDNDVQLLDDTLPRLLLKFGVQAY